ncbi:MAG TPA: SH3 domain-containing protein [Oligoflexia bacterium]|nr:SH3 domain-containing protein [Oligoflexia bacterium]HMP47756.1 SH3 domain-containing protein [Oligoflexia bacterium]
MSKITNYPHITNLSKPDNLCVALDDCGRSDLKTLILNEQYDKIYELLEASPKDEILKIIWCFDQAKQDNLPLAFIASTLHDAVHSKENGMSFRGLDTAPRLSFIICTSVSMLLANQGEFRIGLLLLSAFLDITDPQFLFSSDEKKSFRSLLRDFLRFERDDAQKRKEAKNYFLNLDSLETRIDERERQATLSNDSLSKIEENGSSIDHQSLYESIGFGDSESFTLGAPESASGSLSPSSSHTGTSKSKSNSLDSDKNITYQNKSVNSWSLNKSKSSQRSSNSAFIAWFGLLSVSVLGFALIINNIFFSGSNTSESNDNLAKADNSSFWSGALKALGLEGDKIEDRLVFRFSESIQNLPALSPLPHHNKMQSTTSLDMLSDRLRNISSQTPSQITNESSNISNQSLNKEKPKPLDSDFDPDEIVSLDELPESDGTIKEASPIPKLGESSEARRTAQIAVSSRAEDLGTSGKAQDARTGAPIQSSQIQPRADGRTYGATQMNDPLPSSRGQNAVESAERALDGSVLRSYEVERFEPPRVFETLTSTNVLSAPSLLAPSITRLEAGTPIQVTARMGLWIEIRSNAGKIGYIYAQDATEN